MLPRYTHTLVETFAELFPVIIKSLRDIALKEDTAQCNCKTVADAHGLLSARDRSWWLWSLAAMT